MVIAGLEAEPAESGSKTGNHAAHGSAASPDYFFLPDHLLMEDLDQREKYILNAEAWVLDEYPGERFFPLFDLDGFLSGGKTSGVMIFPLHLITAN